MLFVPLCISLRLLVGFALTLNTLLLYTLLPLWLMTCDVQWSSSFVYHHLAPPLLIAIARSNSFGHCMWPVERTRDGPQPLRTASPMRGAGVGVAPPRDGSLIAHMMAMERQQHKARGSDAFHQRAASPTLGMGAAATSSSSSVPSAPSAGISAPSPSTWGDVFAGIDSGTPAFSPPPTLRPAVTPTPQSPRRPGGPATMTPLQGARGEFASDKGGGVRRGLSASRAPSAAAGTRAVEASPLRGASVASTAPSEALGVAPTGSYYQYLAAKAAAAEQRRVGHASRGSSRSASLSVAVRGGGARRVHADPAADVGAAGPNGGECLGLGGGPRGGDPREVLLGADYFDVPRPEEALRREWAREGSSHRASSAATTASSLPQLHVQPPQGPHADTPLLRKLASMKEALALQEEAARQDTARAAFYGAQRATEVGECLERVRAVLSVEVGHRREGEAKAASYAFKQTDPEEGRLATSIGAPLSRRLAEMEESIAVVEGKLDSIFTNVRALARTSDVSVAKFCGDASEAAVRRRDMLADLFLAVGADRDSRIASEVTFASDVQAAMGRAEEGLRDAARRREAAIGADGALRRAADGLGISSFAAALEGEGGGLLLASSSLGPVVGRGRGGAPIAPKAEGAEDGVAGTAEQTRAAAEAAALLAEALPTRATMAAINSIGGMVQRLAGLLAEASAERRANHEALSLAVADAGEALQIRHGRRNIR